MTSRRRVASPSPFPCADWLSDGRRLAVARVVGARWPFLERGSSAGARASVAIRPLSRTVVASRSVCCLPVGSLFVDVVACAVSQSVGAAWIGFMVIVPAAGVENAATERVGHEHHRGGGMTVDEMTVGRLHQLSHLSHLNHLQDGVHPHGHFAAAGPPRGASRFMITDILSGGSPSGSSAPSAVAGASAAARSPCSSPGGSSSDGPRDLSLHCREGELSDGHESGTDSGLPGENSSVCSNGQSRQPWPPHTSL